MIILGIDPGIATLGYGVIEKDEKGNFRAVDYGVVLTPKDEGLPVRLAMLEEGVQKILEKSIQQTIIGALVKEISKKDIFFYILTACKLKSFFGKLLYFLFKIIFYTEQDKNVF